MSSTINLQNPNIPPPTNAVEIDVAIYELLLKFDANLDWLENGYGRAYRFVDKGDKRLYVPQVYIAGSKKSYYPTTGDNDKKGTCFFIVGKENDDDFETGQFNYIKWEVGIVFWVNLEKINKPLLATEKFTQNLIRDVRHILTMQTAGMSFEMKINDVVTNFNDVYKEFTLDETNDYHRAPYSCFRFNLTIAMQENCDDYMFDPAEALCQNLSQNEKLIVLGCLDFSDQNVYDALTPQQIEDICGAPVKDIFLKGEFIGVDTGIAQLTIDLDSAGVYVSIADDGASGVISISINGGAFVPFSNPLALGVGDTIDVKRTIGLGDGFYKITGTYV